MPVSEAGSAKVEKGRSKPRCGADLSNLLQPQETSEMSFPEAAAPGVFVRLQGTSLRAQDIQAPCHNGSEDFRGSGTETTAVRSGFKTQILGMSTSGTLGLGQSPRFQRWRQGKGLTSFLWRPIQLTLPHFALPAQAHTPAVFHTGAGFKGFFHLMALGTKTLLFCS